MATPCGGAGKLNHDVPARTVRYGTPRESTTFIFSIYVPLKNWEGGTEKLIWISYTFYCEAIDKNEKGKETLWW